MSISELKILVVDEFAINRTIIKNILKELGCENTVEVSDGFEALASLKSKIYSCVIAEWEMSEMKGMDLLIQIREDQLLKKIPVLVVTDDGAKDNIFLATKTGASGFLLKPFIKEKFSEELEKIFVEIITH